MKLRLHIEKSHMANLNITDYYSQIQMNDLVTEINQHQYCINSQSIQLFHQHNKVKLMYNLDQQG